ncbi:uncharacterized protein ARB_04182 [Trichophyton benhamiae CBS 112371]|uniref:Cyclin n=1 Tax=Arthroderma benhamiae (strain ATCC MYA-4681 / CBS 112371) TaxID=663331 RepID=D4AIT4_ARTBC|nr:uncharacterized protein ARB_04182 [Trichophyton benhamiae CBS 112371]EFE36657.1 hypothetical protein ARB_04182 [Trichophyton benhamiae CBS 112371]
MSPTAKESTPEAQPADVAPVAPHPSFIQVANPYIFEKTVQDCFAATGVNPLREDSNRLQGITWIDNVRKALHLYAVRHSWRFFLLTSLRLQEAAAAALFTACKIEDTLKKSRDILCCSYNLKLPPTEQLSADDPIFESHSRSIIGLERLMLESSGFDFRNRHPQKVLMKLTRQCGLDKDSKVGRVAYTISLDLYRTFAPLKQTSATMAFACLELAARLLEEPVDKIHSEEEYKLWETSRAEVMETILDLLELYTHNRSSTSVGPDFSLDVFLNIRIPLNEEADSYKIPRFAYWKKRKAESNGISNGTSSKKSKNSHHRHGKDRPETPPAPPINPMMPTAAHDSVAKAHERSRDTAIRFMLDPEQAQAERETVSAYFKVEMEEYEVEE